MAEQKVPTIERQVTAETHNYPDVGSSIRELAASQNNLSAIGAHVAQVASNTMATQLGYETGKNPKGDLLPPLTEFDRNFAQSYTEQAGATLSLQANKLLTDSQIELSKAPRLTPQLIQKTNEQVQLGLSRIAENAPTAIKGKLSSSFSNELINQNKHLQTRMFNEDRQDQKDTIKNSFDLNIRNTSELTMNGDFKGAMNLVEANKKLAENSLKNNLISKEEARVIVETTQQAFINGQLINQGAQAEKDGKLAEFNKEIAKGPPKGITNEQWTTAGRALLTQQQFIQTLRSQDENLKAQQMVNQIAINPNAITATQLADFKNTVSPQKYEEVKFKYIQALKSAQSQNAGSDTLLQNFSNPEAWANSSEKVKNAAYQQAVDYTVNQAKNSGSELTKEQAQVQVAASAGGQIPVFTNELKNKLSSANPAYIESAAQQIHGLYAIGAGHALQGLNEKDHAAYVKYEALRDSMDPMTAAREMTNAVFNQDPDVQQMNKQKWSNFLTASTSGGTQLDDFALTSVGLNKADFITPAMAQVYGTSILQKYGTYFQLMNGDQKSAQKLTKQFVDQNFGDTGVNGGTYKTLHPLEMVLGFKDKSGVPYIQADIVNQINPKLMAMKEAYDSKKSNEYWETLPLQEKDKKSFFFFNADPKAIQIKRHMRTASGEKTDTYNLVLLGNAFDNWDVAIDSGSGMRNLFQIAPYLGVISYVPNKKAILDSYNKDHPLK